MEHTEALGMEGTQAGQGNEVEDVEEVLGLVRAQARQGQVVVVQVVVDVGTQVEHKVVEWVVQRSVEEEEDRKG